MKLAYRFATIAFFTLLLIFAGFLFSNSQITRKMQAAKEKRHEVNRLSTMAALQSISAQHRLFVRDYSYWDDMATAVQARDLAWISQEFYGPLEIYKASAVWVTDQSGSVLFQTNAGKNVPLPVTAARIPSIASQSELTSFFGYSDGTLVAYHIGPILYHSHEELNTHPYGYVIVAVIWGEPQLQQLQELLQASAQVAPGSTMSQSDATSAQQLVEPFLSHDQQVVATLQLEFHDQSLALLGTLFKEQVVQTSVLGFIGVIGCSIFLHLMIVVPTHALIKKLRVVSSEHSRNRSKKKRSEIAILSDLIDDYVDQAEKIKEKNGQLRSADAEIKQTMGRLTRSEGMLRRQLQESLKLAKTVESASDAIIITDKNSIIQYVNPAWEALNGYSKAEAIGQRPSLLKSNRTNSMVYKHLWEHLEEGAPFSSDDVINRRKDGSLYAAHISVFPVREGNHTVNYVGIAQDISVSKEREHLKSEFISLASHQLRTPLTSLRWFSELLRKQKNQDSLKSKEILKDIEASALRMISLVNRLLNLSRIETGRLTINPSRVNVLSLIKAIRKELDPHLKKKSLRLLVKIQESARTVHTDGELLQEALTNLLSNAMKYTPDKGVIVVKVEKESGYYRFTVADSGIGIPEAEQRRIFERFFRASNAMAVDTQGTGLGLYLVKLIIELLGGEISIKSKEGHGTEISYTLPIKGPQRSGEVSLTPSTIT